MFAKNFLMSQVGVLMEINSRLAQMGYPPFIEGTELNKLYRITTPPRITFGFFSIRVSEVYLEYLGNEEPVKIVLDFS